MKIEANELMIDNYISYLAETKQVLGFDEEKVYFKNTISIDYIDIDEIEPIPLTEEWLLKFGFKLNEFDQKENQYRLKDRLIVIRNSFFHDYGTSVKLESIHQLQNLFFALTNEQLTIK